MFRIVCDPSSGNIELYLTGIIRSGSQMLVVCLVGVWQRNFEPVVCVCTVILNQWCVCVCTVPYTHTTGSKLRCQTPTKHTTNISEPLRIISVKYSSIFPDDGSHTIRNMLEWFLILCLLNFYTVQLLVCNTFCTSNECTVYGTYQTKFSYLEFYIIDF